MVPRARTLEESFMAAGVFGFLLAQVGVNLGMVLGIAPVTGLPLPFMTYGGSNTITNLAAIGLVLAVGIRAVREDPATTAWQERPRRRVPPPTTDPEPV